MFMIHGVRFYSVAFGTRDSVAFIQMTVAKPIFHVLVGTLQRILVYFPRNMWQIRYSEAWNLKLEHGTNSLTTIFIGIFN